MLTLAINLRLETASHRRRMMGIFRQIGATDQYDIRLIPNEESLCNLLTAANGVDRPDGIISGVPYSEHTWQTISRSGVPFIGIGMSEKEIDAPSDKTGFVLNDNAGIGAAAADFFLNLGGFRSYAYVPDVRGRAWSDQRGQSFAAALAKAGKACATCPSDATSTAALSDFLATLPRPIAILAAWDGRAADIIRAAHKANLRIPEHVSILGVDDDELICEHTVPPLSSIRTDAEGMGEEAARLILDLLERKSNRRKRVVRCPILGITERRTTGAPAPATSLIERALAFIDNEATNGIKADDVAKYLKVSRRLLDLRFKQFESKSVTEKIVERKIAAALRLLSDTDSPVKDIFKQAGFGDISYATKLFKKTIGTAPDAWRAENHGNDQPPIIRRKDRDFGFERLADIGPSDTKALKALSGLLDPTSVFDIQALQSAIRHGSASVFVLRHRSAIVASATAVRFLTPTGHHCRIEDVIVAEQFRGKGLGRLIMTQTMEALARDGVTNIELTSRPSRIAANALYQSLGFKRRETNVYAYKIKSPLQLRQARSR